MASVYVPQRFEKLHRVISDAFEQGAAGASAGWLASLDTARLEVADLGRPKGPSDAERKEIEGGEYRKPSGC